MYRDLDSRSINRPALRYYYHYHHRYKYYSGLKNVSTLLGITGWESLVCRVHWSSWGLGFFQRTISVQPHTQTTFELVILLSKINQMITDSFGVQIEFLVFCALSWRHFGSRPIRFQKRWLPPSGSRDRLFVALMLKRLTSVVLLPATRLNFRQTKTIIYSFVRLGSPYLLIIPGSWLTIIFHKMFIQG